MKIAKVVVLSLVCLGLAGTTLSYAKPLSKTQTKKLSKQEQKDQKALKKQMNKMIISIADLDILVNRDNIVDWEIYIDDADRILNAIAEIRKIDKVGVYKKLLNDLETPTKKLKLYSEQKDLRATKQPDMIFDACFKCHQIHRKSWGLD